MKKLFYFAAIVAFAACAGNAQTENESENGEQTVEAPAVEEVTATKDNAFTEGVRNFAEDAGEFIGESVNVAEEFYEEARPRVIEATNTAIEATSEFVERSVEVMGEAVDAGVEGYQNVRQ